MHSKAQRRTANAMQTTRQTYEGGWAMLLAGDIGGTKTDLAIFSHEAGPHSPLAQGEVHSAVYPSLQVLVTEFLKKVKMPVETACFDVAGPVIDGHVKITNLPWSMDEASLAKDLNLKSVRLMNDLEAVARAIPVLRPSDVNTLNVGQPVRNGAVGIERVCSGIGIPNIYEYLADSEHIPESPKIAQLIAVSKDRIAAIVESAMNPENPSTLCAATVDTFISILASEAANLALKVLATGGVY